MTKALKAVGTTHQIRDEAWTPQIHQSEDGACVLAGPAKVLW
eukprot:CAMPEP_0115060270 /NCGR_PEP_ID=MMETSP0227-20121206/7375_1 /TAXON_ID=89957 /ORGANISM="Polarella glacialis, Strain CCMP 1383" /LENGTH=41 /DNA_ID= /DNA_START= /DNA_END= /DNA_ORIENTATION=